MSCLVLLPEQKPMQLPESLSEEQYAGVPRTTDVILVVPDGGRFSVPKHALLRHSKLVRSMFGVEDSQLQHHRATQFQEFDITDDIPIDAENCTSPTAAHLKLWLEEYADRDPVPPQRPLPASVKESPVAAWDLRFVSTFLVPAGDMKHHQALYALASVAIFLDIPALADMCCAYLAWAIREVLDKPDDPRIAVREWFGLSGDFTPAEYAAVKKEHQWCKEITYNDIMSKMTDEP